MLHLLKTKKDGIVDGVLYKFKGDSQSKMKFNENNGKMKYVLYLKNKDMVIYSDNDVELNKNKKFKIINVVKVNTWISNSKVWNNNMPFKYKNSWFKIDGNDRVVVFGTKDDNEANYWYNSLHKSK